MSEEKKSQYNCADKAVFVLIGLTMTAIILQTVTLFLFPY